MQKVERNNKSNIICNIICMGMICVLYIYMLI